MLGQDVYSIFSNESAFNVYGVDKFTNNNIPNERQLIGDLTEKKFIAEIMQKFQPEIFIHCAAIVSLKFCEDNKEDAIAVHAGVPKEINYISKRNTKLIYISTDSVFDGFKGNFRESDEPNPQNYYSKSKLIGEEETMTNDNNLVIRTNIFGFNTPLKSSLAEWAINNFQKGTSITGFTNVVFNAIYTKQLANILLELVKKNNNGVLHLASQNIFSKYSFLRYLAVRLTGKTDLVLAGRSYNINNGLKRPENTSLNVSKALNCMQLPTIEEGIDELVADYKEVILNEN